MQYGLNNNTGVTAANAGNNFSRMQKKVTSAGDNASNVADMINNAQGLLKEWQSGNSGGDKIETIAKAVMGAMGGK